MKADDWHATVTTSFFILSIFYYRDTYCIPIPLIFSYHHHHMCLHILHLFLCFCADIPISLNIDFNENVLLLYIKNWYTFNVMTTVH